MIHVFLTARIAGVVQEDNIMETHQITNMNYTQKKKKEKRARMNPSFGIIQEIEMYAALPRDDAVLAIWRDTEGNYNQKLNHLEAKCTVDFQVKNQSFNTTQVIKLLD